MPDVWLEKIKTLIKTGESFSHSNFAYKRGKRVSRLRPEYISWRDSSEHVLIKRFGEGSPMYETFKHGRSISVLRDDYVPFRTAQDIMLGALYAAADACKLEATVGERVRRPATLTNKVFVVHGHDEQMKNQVEIFLNEIGLEPIVLHRKPDEGLTIIEKLEKHSDVGYAFVLLSPDDVAYHTLEKGVMNSDDAKELRARQNVVFEFGYFVGLLGRDKVCCLYKKGVKLPTDVSGMLYKEVGENVEHVAYPIIKDLQAAGYDVKPQPPSKRA